MKAERASRQVLARVTGGYISVATPLVGAIGIDRHRRPLPLPRRSIALPNIIPCLLTRSVSTEACKSRLVRIHAARYGGQDGRKASRSRARGARERAGDGQRGCAALERHHAVRRLRGGADGSLDHVDPTFSEQPHAVNAISHATGIDRYEYDANGNMTLRVELSGTQPITYYQEFDIENGWPGASLAVSADETAATTGTAC